MLCKLETSFSLLALNEKDVLFWLAYLFCIQMFAIFLSKITDIATIQILEELISPTQISYWRFFYIIFVGKLLTNTIPTSLLGNSFLIIPHITKTESNDFFIIHCFEENKDKHSSIAWNTVWRSFWNLCIVYAAHGLVSNLLAHNYLICRLRWFP